MQKRKLDRAAKTPLPAKAPDGANVPFSISLKIFVGCLIAGVGLLLLVIGLRLTGFSFERVRQSSQKKMIVVRVRESEPVPQHASEQPSNTPDQSSTGASQKENAGKEMNETVPGNEVIRNNDD